MRFNFDISVEVRPLGKLIIEECSQVIRDVGPWLHVHFNQASRGHVITTLAFLFFVLIEFKDRHYR